MDDCLIVGAGVIGLSLAYELSARRWRVRVIDAGQPGKESSWAGAGILPPAPANTDDPVEQLAALSNALHRDWAERLRAETGLDNGYRRCGGVYVADETQAECCAAEFQTLLRRGVAVQSLTQADLADVEPALATAPARGRIRQAWFLPDESQVRNPRHLRALEIACLQQGVTLLAGQPVTEIVVHGGRVQGVRTGQTLYRAGQVVVTAGAWSQEILARVGCSLAVRPVRGQIALLDAPENRLRRIVNEGLCYLVPRFDGQVLVGATQEEVGFDRRTTVGGIAGLLKLAISLAPELATARLARCWAGLRPASADGRPYLGRVPGIEALYVAAGHFRAGLQLSTGTATVMSQLLREEKPAIDLTPFRVER